MKCKYISICSLLIICILCGCKQTPTAKSIDGVYVQADSIEDSQINSSTIYNNKKSIIYSEDSQININIDNESLPDTDIRVSKGSLKEILYDKEELQNIFCPDVMLEEIEYGDGVQCWVNFNKDNDSLKWEHSIMVYTEPYSGYCYTYYPIDKKNESYTENIIWEPETLKTYESQAYELLSQFSTNFIIDNVNCYGDDRGMYFDFDLALVIDDIPCFKDGRNTNDINSYGSIQISEDGLGLIEFFNNFGVDEKQEIEILSIDKIIQFLESYVESKIITPSGIINIDSISLEYKIISDGDGFDFYPIWCLKTKDEIGNSITYVAINAENGEVEYYIGR